MTTWDTRAVGPAVAGATGPPPPPPRPATAGAPRIVPSWGLSDVAISFLIWIATSVVGSVIVVAASGTTVEELENPGIGLTLALMVITWLGFLIWPLIVMVVKGSGRPDRDFGLTVKPIDVAWALAGFAAFWAFSAVAGVVFTIFADGEPPTNTDMVESATTSTGALLALLVGAGLITPVVEELWFRGFFLRAVGKRLGAPAGIVLSSIPFGLLHLQGSGRGDLWIIALLTVYGAILATITVRTEGRLGAAIMCHALNNSLAVLLVGLG